MPTRIRTPPPSSLEVQGAALRRAALAWSLLHVPVFLAVHGASLGAAVAGFQPVFQVLLWPAFAVAAVLPALLAFLLALPFSVHRRSYGVAAPLLAGVMTMAVALDAWVYHALGFHLNGLIVRLLTQPGVLRALGVSGGTLAASVVAAVVWLGLAGVAGGRFLRRFASPRPTLRWVAVAFGLLLVERVYTATLTFYGGPGVFAAAQVLPLQVPLRMNRFLANLTGRGTTEIRDPIGSAARGQARRPPLGVTPGSVRFTRRPDVVVALIETLRADFFDPVTMPRLSRRAEQGSVFTRHYAAASSTHYTLFGLLYGLQSQQLDAVIGSGRPPLLFAALNANGYQVRVLAASAVDWMGMKATVFGDVPAALEADYKGVGAVRDSAMIDHAEAWVAAADTAPLFLFLFFDGTHFNYTYPARSARFAPVWDGVGSVKTARVDPELIRRRARNAAYEVDWELDDLLTWLARRRGGAPLVMVTGDHGEEFWEHGHIAHGSAVTGEQIHVPMVVLGEDVPRGRYDAVTSHIDIVPTLFGLLGDRHPPRAYADGISMYAVPAERFVLSTVGWEPRYCAIGPDLKATFYGLDAGLGGVTITDPQDSPLPDGDARFAARALDILRAFSRPRPR